MGWKFNPFTGSLDQTGSTPSSYIDGEVATYNDLPLSGTTAPLDSAWLVRGSSGIWPFTKPGGVYIRTATGGSSRDADYTYAGVFPDVFSDANFTLYDDSDTSKNLKFQLSGISTGTTRTLTVPNASGRIQVEGQPIGNTTPSTGAFTTLSASGAITAAAGTAGTPTTPATALGVQWSGLGGTDIAAVYGTYSGAGKVGIGVGTFGILTEVASFALGGIALNRATTVSNGTLTASAPVLDLSQTWNNAAANFTSLRLNATNTASGAATFLADFQVSGSSALAILKDGTIGRFNASTGAVRSGLFFNGQSANRILVTAGDSPLLYLAPDDLGLAGPAIIRWDSSGGSPTSTGVGLALLRDGANNVLGQRNGANAQAYRLYNTYTDASNYERGFIGWSSNTLRIGTEKGGTGSARALEFQTDGTTKIRITVAGSLLNTTTGFIGWDTSTLLQPTSGNGTLALYNTAQNDFGRLQFGGTTSSFPALKRSSTTLQVRLADDSAFAPLEALSFTTANSRIVCDDTNTVLHVGNTPRVTLSGVDGTFLALHANHEIRWATGRSDQAAANPSVILVRDGANDTLAMRRTTNGQTFRLYNTVSGTNNVNFDRVNFRWASNEFIIDAEAGGTGTLRGIKIGSATSSLLGFYGATPVDRPATVADPAGGGTIDAEARTAINDIIDRLQELGLIA